MKILSSHLLLAVLALFGLGLVQVYSSSFIFATEAYGNGLYFFNRQMFFVGVAVLLMIVCSQIPIRYFEKMAWALWGLNCVFLIATFIPSLSFSAGGARRWLMMPMGFHFEPSEIMKVAFPIFFSSVVLRLRKQKDSIWLQLALLLWTVLPLILLSKQPDFGSFVLLVVVAMGILFVAELKLRWFVLAGTIMAPIGYWMMMKQEYRRARILAFLDPWSDPAKQGFQMIQSLLSFYNGGITGSGVGQGQGKLFFLPEAHTDFTLAVFGEEFGFIGLVALLVLYGFIVYKLFQIAMAARAEMTRLMLTGFALMFGLSVFINVGVVLGMLPTKGLTMPFLSYGGSSLIALGILFGLVLSEERTQ